MKERPILFNGDMVRAILSGEKTQTRRVADTGLYAVNDTIHGEEIAERERTALLAHCPYGQPGDRLWVRETFAYCVLGTDNCDEAHSYSIPASKYERDCKSLNTYHIAHRAGENEPVIGPWHPSIHMPRWASRITLEIVGVRVERLQDITDAGARSEGFKGVGAFADCWNSIYKNWHENTWVWVVEFKRVEAL